MMTLTQSGLRDLLYGLRGTVPVSISALTQVKLPKKAGFVGDVLKLARVHGLTGTDYHGAMERADSSHERHARAWGSRLSGSLVEGKEGKMYLSVRVQHRLATVYLARHGAFLKTMRESELPDLPKRDERPIEVRDYSLASIKRIAIGGRRYRVVEDGLALRT